MDLLPPALGARLRFNAAAHHQAMQFGTAEPDPAPVLKLFNPVGIATWLATELDADGDTLFGLADLGFGCPELGTFSLNEIAALRLPLGLSIARDRWFATAIPLSVWADTARLLGSIPAAERTLCRPEPPLPRPPEINPLPPSDPEGG